MLLQGSGNMVPAQRARPAVLRVRPSRGPLTCPVVRSDDDPVPVNHPPVALSLESYLWMRPVAYEVCTSNCAHCRYSLGCLVVEWSYLAGVCIPGIPPADHIHRPLFREFCKNASGHREWWSVFVGMSTCALDLCKRGPTLVIYSTSPHHPGFQPYRHSSSAALCPLGAGHGRRMGSPCPGSLPHVLCGM